MNRWVTSLVAFVDASRIIDFSSFILFLHILAAGLNSKTHLIKCLERNAVTAILLYHDRFSTQSK